jgi:hypothetical protein
VAIAAPGPGVLLALYQAAFDWIAMDVGELLDQFAVGEDVEVVIRRLPHIAGILLAISKRLLRIASFSCVRLPASLHRAPALKEQDPN